MTTNNKDKNTSKTKARAIYNYVKEMPEDAIMDLEENKRAFFKRVQTPQKKNYFIRYAAAAAVAVLLTSTVFIYFVSSSKEESANTSPVVINNNIVSGSDNAILTLENGSDVALGNGQIYQTASVQGNDELIAYSKKTKEEIAYNTLTIPRGGKYKVVLSDGTKIWLNSESKLKFPVDFKPGKTRTVELVYGEAFFDVSPSEDNEGTSFKVMNKNQEIEVVGTEFNIRAYQGDPNIITTLVEGKVIVGNTKEKKSLLPNQKSVLDLGDKEFVVKDVEDVFNDVSWRNDIFSFDDKSLKDIMKELSRWYSIDHVVFEKEAIQGAKYVGVINRNQNIVDILSIMRDLHIINSFDINDKTIVLR